jgi:aspartate aminotransferase
MIKLANRLNTIVESNTLRMSKLSRELQAQGKDVINLSLGEPDFQTPQHIKDAAKKAIDDGFTFYTPVVGYLDLRQAISEKFKNENGLFYAPDQIVVSTGAKQAIINVLLSLLNPGDEVIIPTPYWVTYSEIVKLAGGKPILVNTQFENDYKIT